MKINDEIKLRLTDHKTNYYTDIILDWYFYLNHESYRRRQK